MALENFGGVIMFILTGVGAYYAYFKDTQAELDKTREEVNRQVFLDAYTIEVTCPLADRSTLRVSLHFQVPRDLNVVAYSSPYGGNPQDSHFVDKVTRATEAKLVRYTQGFTDPPSYAEIEEHLRRELLCSFRTRIMPRCSAWMCPLPSTCIPKSPGASMYRSKYGFEPAPDKHQTLETIELAVQKHFEPPVFDTSVLIPYPVRNQHVYVPGKTRHGKSTLFHSMALQDIQNGAGVCVIDPKGDLVNSLIHHVPESRDNYCVYLSPQDPVPIDFMDYRNDDEKETLVGELKYVITRGMGAKEAPLMDAIMTDLLYTLFQRQ